MAKDDFQYDVAIIGSGPGGYVAAIRAAQEGLKVACIEKEATLGGTCLNVGCIPSKALLQSTEYFETLAKKGKEHGISFDNLKIDFDAMQKRKAAVVEGLVGGVAGLLKRNGVDCFKGVAAFLDPHRLGVSSEDGKKEISAKNFIVATGSHSIELPFLPFDEETILSSTGTLALKAVPKKMLIIGAGVIGVELASVYARLGSEVIVIEMLDRICPMMDGAVSKVLLQLLKKQGIAFHLNAKVLSGKKDGEKVVLKVMVEGKELEFTADKVLVAIGRKPAGFNLGLEKIGVRVSARGFVEVDDFLRTSIPHIYAIGDVVDGSMLAHRASEEGIVAAELIAGLKPHINYLAIPNIIYTNPEVAAIGLTEEEAKAAGLQVSVGICQFKGNARARCHGDVEGFVKVIAEKDSERLIGMHIVGAHASEMIGEGVFAFINKNTLLDVVEASHAHPTRCEAIKEACLAALSRPIHI